MNFEPEIAQGKASAKNTDLPLLMAWERLRVVYNLVLIVIVVIIAASRRMLWSDHRFPVFLFERVVLANLCFCAGPVIDGYLHLLKIGGRPSRLILFFCGLVLSILITIVSVTLYPPWIAD